MMEFPKGSGYTLLILRGGISFATAEIGYSDLLSMLLYDLFKKGLYRL